MCLQRCEGAQNVNSQLSPGQRRWMKVVIVQGVITIRRNFRLCREGEAVFHLRSLIYCAELYSQYRFSSGQTQYSSFLPCSGSVWLLRGHGWALQDTWGTRWQCPCGRGAEPALVVRAVPLSCELQGAARTGQRHRPCVCRAVQGNGSPGKPPVSCQGSCKCCADTYHVSLWPFQEPEARRSKVIMKLLLLFPSLAAIPIPCSLGNTAFNGIQREDLARGSAVVRRKRFGGLGMLFWCSPLSELLIQKEIWSVHIFCGTSAIPSAQKNCFVVHLCSY